MVARLGDDWAQAPLDLPLTSCDRGLPDSWCFVFAMTVCVPINVNALCLRGASAASQARSEVSYGNTTQSGLAAFANRCGQGIGFFN